MTDLEKLKWSTHGTYIMEGTNIVNPGGGREGNLQTSKRHNNSLLDVEKITMEKACKAVCPHCANGTLLPAEHLIGKTWVHKYPSNPKSLKTTCAASPIRTSFENDN